MAGKSSAARLGVLVCGRASVSATQPVPGSLMLIGLRYTLLPIWRTVARLRMGDTLLLASKTLWVGLAGFALVQIAGRLVPIPNLLLWSLLPPALWLLAILGYLLVRPLPARRVAQRVDSALDLRERLTALTPQIHELVRDRRTKEAMPADRIKGVVDFARRNGVIVGRSGGGRHLGSTIVLSPPLVITRAEIDRVVAVLDKAIQEMGGQLGAS